MAYLAQYLFAIAAVIILPLYYYYMKVYRIEQFFKKFPNPTFKPFVGNVEDFTSTSAILKAFHRYKKEHGSLVHMKLGPGSHTLLCSDHKFLEFILSSNKLLKKTYNLKFLKPWVGEGLITVNGGPKWKIHRKIITPAFHFKILEQFVDIFESDGDILVEKLAKKSGSASVDIYPYITLCTLDAICETAMGTKVDVQNNETSNYVESVRHMCKIFVLRSMSVFIRHDFFYQFTEDYRKQQKAVKILHDYTDQVINERRENLRLKNHMGKNRDVDDLGRRKKKAFLDLILEATVDGQSLSNEEIREEVDTFMFAGHDTTATASCFILYCIANHKEVQDKIIEEQKEIFGNDLKNARATYANLQEMKYLEAVIKEGLRLYPPVPFVGREIDQDVEYDGMKIPKGVRVNIFIYGIHMDPKYYPDPEKFDPSRFENNEGRPTYAFIPFSAGARNCIGQKFAIVELKSLVSKIVRNFELFPAIPTHHMILCAETVMKSQNGVKIGLKLRHS